jgi:hypothetical protein
MGLADAREREPPIALSARKHHSYASQNVDEIEVADGREDGHSDLDFALPKTLPVIVWHEARALPTRKLAALFDGTEDDDVLPNWVIESVAQGKFGPSEQLKCQFMLMPAEGSRLPHLAMPTVAAPRIVKARSQPALNPSKP